MTEELKPCPFCGSTDIDAAFAKWGDGAVSPGCMQCGATAETTEKWNERRAGVLAQQLTSSEIAQLHLRGGFAAPPAERAPSSDSPVAWIAFAENGHVRFWTDNEADCHRAERAHGFTGQPFTLSDLVARISLLVARPSPAASDYKATALQWCRENIRDIDDETKPANCEKPCPACMAMVAPSSSQPVNSKMENGK